MRRGENIGVKSPIIGVDREVARFRANLLALRTTVRNVRGGMCIVEWQTLVVMDRCHRGSGPYVREPAAVVVSAPVPFELRASLSAI